MALPAGRYGVTKNQLLKIKKLPMNTIKLIEELTEKFNLLGAAAFKNSTSVVTDSTNLVESGAVKDIIGWGNKNLLPNNLKSGTYGNACVMTHNTDGSITVSGQNTASDDISIEIFTLPYDTVKGLYLSGVSNGSATSYMLFARIQDASLGYVTEVDNFNGSILIPTGIDQADSVRFNVRVKAGYSFPNPVTIYPMISKDGGAYEPYHESIADSLEEKADNSVIGTVEDGATASQAYAVGEHFIRDGAFCTCIQAIAQGGSFILGTNYTVGDVASELEAIDITSQCSFSQDCSFIMGWTHIYKVGKIIWGSLRFITPSEVTADKLILTLPNSCKTPLTVFIGIASKIWTGETKAMLQINANTPNIIRLTSTTWEASAEVVANIMFKIE